MASAWAPADCSIDARAGGRPGSGVTRGAIGAAIGARGWRRRARRLRSASCSPHPLERQHVRIAANALLHRMWTGAR
jgi:hypothetical protein